MTVFTWSMSKAWRPPQGDCRRRISGSTPVSNSRRMDARRGRRIRSPIIRDDFVGTRYDYEATVLDGYPPPVAGYKRYPAVFPSWDNTPRQPLRGDSFIHATPEAFQVYVEEKLE